MTIQNPLLPPLIFNSVFDDFFRGLSPTQRVPQTGFPVVDNYLDEDGNSILEFALAGYKAEELSVSVEGSTLYVSSEGVKTEKKGGLIRRIARRSFKQSYTDRENRYNLNNLEASFIDGVLRIVLPKKEASKAKTFEILTNQKQLSD